MANEKRLIDAKEGKKRFCAIAQPAEYKGVIHLVVPISEIDKLPTVDAVEVVHSSWILNNDGSGTCKNCHRTTKDCWDYDRWMNYCPNCGADMRDGDGNALQHHVLSSNRADGSGSCCAGVSDRGMV